jgi:hypothetical protein
VSSRLLRDSLQAKEKLAYMQEAYKELNSELLTDIPALYGDRAKFFTPLFATVRL